MGGKLVGQFASVPALREAVLQLPGMPRVVQGLQSSSAAGLTHLTQLDNTLARMLRVPGGAKTVAVPKPTQTVSVKERIQHFERAGGGEVQTVKVASTSSGRAGKQSRLKELMVDPKISSSDRGWLKQDYNQIQRSKRQNFRVPPGKELAHKRGFEAAKGYDYSHSNLQEKGLHKLQHKFDDMGRKNKTPVERLETSSTMEPTNVLKN